MNKLVRDVSELKPSDVKVGRFINNFLKVAKIQFTEPELNDFISKYKAEMKELKEKFTRFEIVKGNDIAHWYYDRNYEDSSKGTMGSSCMKGSECQKFFDIYTQNDQVSLIILKSKNNEYEIIGRALLWDAEFINREDTTEDSNIKFMDRIYTNDYSDEAFFKKFAKENGFYYKRDQDTSDTPLMYKGVELDNDSSLITVSLDSGGGYRYYPYMDTLKYYNPDDGTLSNDDNSNYEYLLNETEGGNGSCRECGGNGEMECENCSGSGEVRCDECYNGSNNCRDCDGTGNTECYNCEGYGEIDCNTCDGSGEEDCSVCDGSGEDGEEECSKCGGSGKEECTDCDGNGKNECNTCEGEGTNECQECDGSGDIPCEDCYGEGTYECYKCEGEGRHNCNECNPD